MDRHILIKNFWNVGLHGDKSVAKEDLGWTDYIKRDAQSDYPETIFRYIVEVEGLNIFFIGSKTKISTALKREIPLLKYDGFILIQIGMENVST